MLKKLGLILLGLIPISLIAQQLDTINVQNSFTTPQMILNRVDIDIVLWRDDDDIVGDVKVKEFDIHYEFNKPGSNTEYE